MKIYNTLTKQIETFTPHKEGVVNLYTCGPTVYHFAHIGNLRCYIFEDILEKALTYVGYKVNRVMNITDVGHMTSDADEGEDKMLKGAKREHKTVYEIADFYTEAFFADTHKLNIKKPPVIEKASSHIDMYIKMIEKLLEDGFAYKEGGNVYFDISKAKDYYALSGMNTEDLMVGAREDVEEDAHKKNPYDFGLWFTVSKFENQAMQWDSPWGRGYPGWHIECSGIALTYLGEYLDIHCGGIDNIFPHHTNEIAQSEAFIGHPWCKYWMHSEHLNDQTGKMSKSNGEFLTLSVLEKKGFSPLVYRLFCLNSHYRKTLVFSYEAMEQTKNTYEKLLSKIDAVKKEAQGEVEEGILQKFQTAFKENLENDLNTASALTTLYDVLKAETTAATKIKLIEEFDTVLSLDLLKDKTTEITAELETYIKEQINLRTLAKQEKDFTKADAIREALLEKGIEIKDTREGTIFSLR
ncbi:MAG: cysteine--tRNA ligase [Bacilli bacterium]|nr:cysteine--tRNA ligase [Bacilli bacterium]